VAARLRDVADLAGVSPGSVSNVITGHPNVSPAMRTKVQAAIDELGYKPNLLARGLRRGRTGTLGLLVPEINVPYFGELTHQIVEQARTRDLTVRIDETSGERRRERYLLELMTGSGTVDGVLFSPFGLTGPDLVRLKPKVPVVLLGERATSSRLDHVGIHNVAAAREVTKYLIDSGHTRIAAMAEPERMRAPTSRLRLKGYRAALISAGVEVDPQLIARVSRYQRQDGADGMAQLLNLPTLPDAVFCFNDLLALGALYELRTHGVRVPDDISVVGFDDIEECRFSDPSLTTVAPDKAAIARNALDLVSARVRGSTEPRRDIRIAYRLTVRESTMAKPRTADLGGDDGMLAEINAN
jgi:LacI family repressor for deo operon, udp, cdd, tsx, nupC, and nupG